MRPILKYCSIKEFTRHQVQIRGTKVLYFQKKEVFPCVTMLSFNSSFSHEDMLKRRRNYV